MLEGATLSETSPYATFAACSTPWNESSLSTASEWDSGYGDIMPRVTDEVGIRKIVTQEATMEHKSFAGSSHLPNLSDVKE